jgi:excisionase family DNA binding protein
MHLPRRSRPADVSERDQERLLTARELASQLGASPETILRWTRRGEVPAFKLPGGAIRYRAADVEAWLQTRSTPKREHEC